jgi:hypothetical protein
MNGQPEEWHGEDVCLPDGERPLRRHRRRRFSRRPAARSLW